MTMLSTFAVGLLALMLASIASAAQPLPATSHDGLPLVPDTKLSAVYMRQDADLSEYDKIAVQETYVSFRKNWRRDYNRDTISLTKRVSDKDMQEIRD